MSQESEKGLGAKLLIIVFGLAMAAIGAEHIREKYGSILNFIGGDTAAFAGQFTDKNWRGSYATSRRKADGQFSRSRDNEAESKEAVVRKDAEAKRSDMDRLSTKDRKSLDRLIQGLN